MQTSVGADEREDVAHDERTEFDGSSIRDAYDDARHRIVAKGGVYRARNPGQRWVTEFDGRGFTAAPDTGAWSWGLELRGYGWGEDRRAVAEPRSVRAQDGRISYVWDDVITEWYVNDARGLEHGYTVAARHAASNDPLTVTVAVRGPLQAQIAANGRDVDFRDAEGAVLSYSGLVVVDADGVELPARFAPLTCGLRLTVDDAGARYPITIDPIAQQARLKASNAGAHDRFGGAVAISGDTVVVGAAREDGAATGVVGDPLDNSAPDAGAAYVFVRNGTTWVQQAYLKASNADPGDEFGHAVAISGDTIVVTAIHEDSAIPAGQGQSDNSMWGAGAAYVFVRSGTTWTQQAYLKPAEVDNADLFGWSVGISGDTIVVGTPFEDSQSKGLGGDPLSNASQHSGAAYVFVRSGTTWTQEAYLKASNTDKLDHFGWSAAVSGDTIAIGAPWEDAASTGVNGSSANVSENTGAVYVFVRSGTSWTQQAYVKASNTNALDEFGGSVAIADDTLVVGATNEASASTGVNGNPFNNAASAAGAAYVFSRSGTTWAQQAYLKASNTDANDRFGHSVAVDGDTIVVGANNEASASTGVNGDPSNNSAAGSGAAYVFTRAGGIWAQQAYLKAADAGAGDEFGTSVAVSGDARVVGAPGESSPFVFNGVGASYVFDDCQASASAATYGSGKAGTIGVPLLSTVGTPIIGSSCSLTLTGGLPLAGPVLLLAGFAPASVPFDGGSLLVTPTLSVVLASLDAFGGLQLPATLSTWSCGLTLYMQAMFVDPGAPGPYLTAQTNGVAWTIGG